MKKNPRYVSFYKYKRFEEDNDPDKRIGPGAYYDGIEAMQSKPKPGGIFSHVLRNPFTVPKNKGPK